MESFVSQNFRLWIARFLIGLVIFFNLESALFFMIWPEQYLAAYELTGIPGKTALRGFAILFCMWNIPYLFAFWHPQLNHTSLKESILMQGIGLIGESWLMSQIPEQVPVLRNSIFRFIVFDGTGFLLLMLAFWITLSLEKNKDSFSKKQFNHPIGN